MAAVDYLSFLANSNKHPSAAISALFIRCRFLEFFVSNNPPNEQGEKKHK
ncbi:hypothetical protein [Lentibacillus kimchii]